MPGFISDDPLALGLISIGDEAIAREDDAKLRDYFRHRRWVIEPGVSNTRTPSGSRTVAIVIVPFGVD